MDTNGSVLLVDQWEDFQPVGGGLFTAYPLISDELRARATSSPPNRIDNDLRIQTVFL